MVEQWKAAAIITIVYLFAFSISLYPHQTDISDIQVVIMIILDAAYIFCLVMLGLGISSHISGFDPLPLRRGAKAIPGLLLGALILVAVSGFIFSVLGQGLIALGITGPSQSTGGLEIFQGFSLLQIFLLLLGGAGIAEEAFYRLFVVGGLWCLLHRPALAIVTSAALFGLYHLTPLDSLYLTFWQYPLYQFIVTFLFGLGAGFIYQWKGLEAVILGHTLGDFIGAVIMKLSYNA